MTKITIEGLALPDHLQLEDTLTISAQVTVAELRIGVVDVTRYGQEFSEFLPGELEHIGTIANGGTVNRP